MVRLTSYFSGWSLALKPLCRLNPVLEKQVAWSVMSDPSSDSWSSRKRNLKFIPGFTTGFRSLFVTVNFNLFTGRNSDASKSFSLLELGLPAIILTLLAGGFHSFRWRGFLSRISFNHSIISLFIHSFGEDLFLWLSLLLTIQIAIL